MALENQMLLENGLNEKQDTNFQWRFSSPARTVKWFILLVRRFLVSIILKPTNASRERQLKPTAWLDGLRGFAAFLVYWHHHQLWVHNATGLSEIMENSYGYEGKYNFSTFPYIRTFFTGGHFAVTTFFVISGYVLSVKSLALIHKGDYEKLQETLASAMFRRWFRLFIPVWGTTFLWMTSWHAFGLWTAPFEPQPNYIAELTKWWIDVKDYSFVFRAKGMPWVYYNLHTWSIPYEFKGSMVVYILLMALSRSRKNARLICQLAVIIGSLFVVDGWFVALFVGGMLLCDLDMLASKNELPKFLMAWEPHKNTIFTILLPISLYLGDVPLAQNNYEQLRRSPGWSWLALLKPAPIEQPKWFYLFWASTSLVAIIQRLPWLKGFFNTRFCQYLGRISFSLYLVHGPVIWTLGDKIYIAIGVPKDPSYFENPPSYFRKYPISQSGPLGLEPATLLPHIVLLPFTLWVSNIMTKVFDETSVKIAAWMHRMTM